MTRERAHELWIDIRYGNGLGFMALITFLYTLAALACFIKGLQLFFTPSGWKELDKILNTPLGP